MFNKLSYSFKLNKLFLSFPKSIIKSFLIWDKSESFNSFELFIISFEKSEIVVFKLLDFEDSNFSLLKISLKLIYLSIIIKDFNKKLFSSNEIEKLFISFIISL
jgi:hypothetical protein